MDGIGAETPEEDATPPLTARWIAAAVAIVAVGALCGWALAIPALKSVVPGAVEMKVNTAIALFLAATSLFMRSGRPSTLSGYIAAATAVTVAAIGLVTLLEYLLGWHAGIDEAIFRDVSQLFASTPGRMSPFSAVAFLAIGVALAVMPRRRMRPAVFLGVLITLAIGLISLLGYLWNARELTTDQWIPPVAIHTAVALILLALGIAVVAPKQRMGMLRVLMQRRGQIEAKVLVGFALALLLLCVGGGITYRTQANQSRSGQLLVATQQARAALGATYAAIADAESIQRNYLLTDNKDYRAKYFAAVRDVTAQLDALPASGLDPSAEQRASLQRLKVFASRRLDSLSRHVGVFERDGDAAVRHAIATDDGVTNMFMVRNTIAVMDAHEAALSRVYSRQLTRDRSYSLIAMLGTLMTATATLLFLFASIVRDIAERAQITAALGRAQQEAQKATVAKSQFLAAMSHEIRTPMNGVVGMVELLEQSSLLGPQMQMVQLIRESAHSLLTIINDILDFSKIEAGRFEIETLPMSLGEVVEGACSLLNRLAERQKTVLTVFCDPAIPAQVIGDETRLRQIIVNLANNAIKFSSGLKHPGRVAVRAVLEEQTADQAVIQVSVVDNGIGMDAATQQRLFTSFMQADVSTTRRYGGTGLGLVISKQLVELMGGTIAVKTVTGGGSTFTLRLPFKLPQAAAQEVAKTPTLADLSCLVIGGQGGVADDLASYLGSEGAAVARLPELSLADGWTKAHADSLAVWVVEAADDLPTLEKMLATLKLDSRPDVRVVMVVLGRGQRNAHAEAKGFVMVDGNALSRAALVNAVGAAAGRVSADPAPQSGPPRGHRPVLASRAEACRNRRLILVAEDNEINQRLISEQLGLLGYTADIVANGLEALHHWQTGDYALLFVDLHMPEMDGYDLTLAVRVAEANTRAPRTPIIALTANALQGEAERCRAVGMDDYLTKPASLAKLTAAAEKWLPSAAPGSVGAAEQPAGDVRALEALIGSDPHVVKSFLEHFGDSAARSATELTAACNAGQSRQAAAVAHKLKSSARSVGAERLAALCVEIEAAGNDHALERVLALLPVFQAEVDTVQVWLRRAQGTDQETSRCA